MAKLPKAKFLTNIQNKMKVRSDVRRLERARKIDEGVITKTSRSERFERAKKVGRSLKGYGIATGAGIAGAAGETIVHRVTADRNKKKRK